MPWIYFCNQIEWILMSIYSNFLDENINIFPVARSISIKVHTLKIKRISHSLLFGTGISSSFSSAAFAAATGLLALPGVAIVPRARITSPPGGRAGSVPTTTMTGPRSITLLLWASIVGELPWREDSLCENWRFSRRCIQQTVHSLISWNYW